MHFIKGKYQRQTFFNTTQNQVNADNPQGLYQPERKDRDTFIEKPGLQKTRFKRYCL